MPRRRFLALLLVLLLPALARAAELDGVRLPEREEVAGTTLRLNGAGVRTASIFDVHVYVAGLFLQQPSHDPETIIHSDRPRLLELHLLRELSAERARAAWTAAFDRTCHEPCQLRAETVRDFLAAVPDMRQGDVARFLFTADTLRVEVNGRELGTIHDPQFEQTVLATFLGAAPASVPLRRALLGLPD